jgi:hypothetical protein
MSGDDVSVGAAYADRQRADEHRTVRERRIGNVFNPR